MTNANNQEKKLTVRAVERAMDILICFIDHRELTLTEIAKEIQLNKSTVYRLLNTLEKKGFLIKNSDTEKYRIGYRIWELSANLSGIDDPATLLLPEMKKLRDRLDETISLYVRDGIERIRIQSVESNQTIRRVAPIGARLSLSVGASSKVLIAFEAPQQRYEILNNLEKKHGIVRASFQQMIEDVRSNGYATSFEERETGATAISVPIFNRSDKMVAALSISGPVNRLTLERLKHIVPIAKEAAAKMGNLLT